MYDILIKNARIADGTGNPMYHADVAVKDGKIAKIGYNLKVDAKKVVDGRGKVLAPGLIDAHSHLDGRIEEVNHCRHMLAQGVTTIIGGMCGDSPVPFTEEHFSDCLRSVGGTHSEESLRARGSLTDYRRHLERFPLGANFTFLIGHSVLRAAVLVIAPGFPVSAKWGFTALDKKRIAPDEKDMAETAAALLSSAAPFEAWQEFCHNDLGFAIFEKFPITALYREFLLEHRALTVQVCGSGPSLFALFADTETALAAGKALRADTLSDPVMRIFCGQEEL